ncbi:MAG TPA: hypothetical protein VM619_14835 [Luteimonas sp.]|nr:hypothetical protein [Luteimonas sp.]
MSFDDDFAATDLLDIYETFGVDATVARGAAAAVPLRIVVDRNQARLGDYGQVVARIDRVRCMASDWTFRQGDVVAWTDRFGAHSKPIEVENENDGMESFGVLNG